MPLWDTLPADPLTLDQVLSLWKRDSVEEVILRRSEAEDDAITRMWIETEHAFHGLENPHDARWTRFDHVKKESEDDMYGVPLGAFITEDTFPFSDCVQHVEQVGGGRQYLVGDLPEPPDAGDHELPQPGADVGPDALAGDDAMGPDDLEEWSGDTAAFTVATDVRYAPYVEYGERPDDETGSLLARARSRLTAQDTRADSDDWTGG